MKAYVYSRGFEERLVERIRPDCRLLGPVTAEDGVCRLRPVERWRDLSPGALPLIPLKMTVLPPRDTLWTLGEEGDYGAPPPPSGLTALLGIPSCDLHALAYLDRVFADDPLYRRRRDSLLLLGAACEPGKECFCPPRAAPPPFDLFLDGDRVWAGSEAGERLLEGMQEVAGSPEDLPLPEIHCEGSGMEVPEDLEDIFQTAKGAPLWREVGERCVSCGACSAVCPTCYCYRIVDESLPGGSVTRFREWDNCFFRNHALVAGGRNFRPTRTERLRFRFEHKLLGFGPLRSVSSCVGCGRCRRACPVDIDISEVLSALTGEAQR